MAVFIREVISEVVLDAGETGTPASSGRADADRDGGRRAASVDEIVRRAAERVLEQLRREWDR